MALFPEKASAYKPDLPAAIDGWLQTLCAFDPEDRFPSAAVALAQLNALLTPGAPVVAVALPTAVTPLPAADLNDLPKDYILDNRFTVQHRLGKPGGFGVAYKVFDNLGDVSRVIQLVTKDKHSVYDRLRQEYKTLVQVPDHPHVVKVVWADRLADETPYIVFEYLDGLDVEKQLENEALSLEDAKKIAEQTAAGLIHLHQHGIYHQDIKPSNLLWTDQGVRIIDFNVAVSDQDDPGLVGGTRRYIPPDFDWNRRADQITPDEKRDRDLYALGITFYECASICRFCRLDACFCVQAMTFFYLEKIRYPYKFAVDKWINVAKRTSHAKRSPIRETANSSDRAIASHTIDAMVSINAIIHNERLCVARCGWSWNCGVFSCHGC